MLKTFNLFVLYAGLAMCFPVLAQAQVHLINPPLIGDDTTGFACKLSVLRLRPGVVG